MFVVCCTAKKDVTIIIHTKNTKTKPLTSIIKQTVVLRHYGHSGSNGLFGYVGNIYAVHEDRTAVYLEHTRDELQCGTLACVWKYNKGKEEK